jgi:hypothetical protein
MVATGSFAFFEFLNQLIRRAVDRAVLAEEYALASASLGLGPGIRRCCAGIQSGLNNAPANRDSRGFGAGGDVEFRQDVADVRADGKQVPIALYLHDVNNIVAHRPAV